MIEAPTTQERYAQAITSTNLRCDTQEGARGSADLLIAAGWCKSKFGAALMRLQAEWDGAERWGVKTPVKPTKRAIMAEAQVTMRDGIRKITKDSMEAARLKLEKRYEAEMRKAVAALKSLPEVALHLQIGLALDGEDAELAAPLLLYWLDPNCRVCHGRKFQLAPCKTKLAARACGCCDGLGAAKAPGGESGQKLLDFINSCALRAGGEVKKACLS